MEHVVSSTKRVTTFFPIRSHQSTKALYGQEIDAEGLFVSSHRPFWPGTLLTLKFTLAGQDTELCVTARVQELVEIPQGIGLDLQFIMLSPENLSAIQKFLGSTSTSNQGSVHTIDAKIDPWLEVLELRLAAIEAKMPVVNDVSANSI
jgi:hypothetical protein